MTSHDLGHGPLLPPPAGGGDAEPARRESCVSPNVRVNPLQQPGNRTETVMTTDAPWAAGRAYALEFLRRSTGVDRIPIEPNVLDEIFTSLTEGTQPVGKPPTWIDDLIRQIRGKEWPAPPLNLCLTHDVDFTTSRDQGLKFLRRLNRALTGDGPRHRALLTALGSLARLLTQPRAGERYGDFMDWLRLEDRYGYRSTFFFLPYPVAHPHVLDGDYRFSDRVKFDGRLVKVSEMMREISDAGWEVGLHGTINSASMDGLLRQQKAMVEQAIGREVVCVRQHFLRRTHGVTHRLQAEAGFKVDSTVGHTRAIGLSVGTSHPYPAWDSNMQSQLPLVEVPLIAMDTPLLIRGIATTGPAEAIKALRAVGTGIASAGGVFCLNWHPHNLPVSELQEVYIDLLTWSKGLGAVTRRMDSFAVPG